MDIFIPSNLHFQGHQKPSHGTVGSKALTHSVQLACFHCLIDRCVFADEMVGDFEAAL